MSEYRIYEHDGSWYWEDSNGGHGPFDYASQAARDLQVTVEQGEDLPF